MRGRFAPDLPVFLHFYPGLTPCGYYLLTVGDYRLMKEYLIRFYRARAGSPGQPSFDF